MIVCQIREQYLEQLYGNQWWVQDFPEGGAPTPKCAIILHFLAKTA